MKQSELLQQQLNADAEASKAFGEKPEHLIEREHMIGTPFTLISAIPDKGDMVHFMVLGKHRVSPNMPSKDTVYEYLKANTWHLISVVISIFCDQYLEIREQQAWNGKPE